MERRPLDDVMSSSRRPPRPLRYVPTLREMEAERDALRLELERAKALIANCSDAPARRRAR
jgi:hypothetical protein